MAAPLRPTGSATASAASKCSSSPRRISRRRDGAESAASGCPPSGDAQRQHQTDLTVAPHREQPVCPDALTVWVTVSSNDVATLPAQTGFWWRSAAPPGRWPAYRADERSPSACARAAASRSVGNPAGAAHRRTTRFWPGAPARAVSLDHPVQGQRHPARLQHHLRAGRVGGRSRHDEPAPFPRCAAPPAVTAQCSVSALRRDRRGPVVQQVGGVPTRRTPPTPGAPGPPAPRVIPVPWRRRCCRLTSALHAEIGERLAWRSKST